MRILLLAGAFWASCSVNAGYDGTSFKCSETEPCPSGQQCENGICVLGSPMTDAMVGGDSGGGPDAAVDECQEPLALSDNFEDSATHAQWTPFSEDGVTVVEDGGRLEIDFVARPGTREGGYRSTDTFDLVGRRVFVEVPKMADVTKPREVRLGFESNQQNGYFIEQVEGSLVVGTIVGGTRMDDSLPYDFNAHRWWQLRELDGEVIVETSGDGASWQERGRYGTESFASAAQIELRMRGIVLDGLDSVRFDNLNVGDDCP